MHSPFKVPAILPDGLSGSISEQCVRMGITRSKLIFCPPFVLVKFVHLNPIYVHQLSYHLGASHCITQNPPFFFAEVLRDLASRKPINPCEWHLGSGMVVGWPRKGWSFQWRRLA